MSLPFKRVLTSVVVADPFLQTHHGGVETRGTGPFVDALVQGLLVASAVDRDAGVDLLQLVHGGVGRAADGTPVEVAQLPADRARRDVIEVGVADEGPGVVAEEVDGAVRDGLARAGAEANCRIMTNNTSSMLLYRTWYVKVAKCTHAGILIPLT